MVEYVGQVAEGSVPPVVQRADARPRPTLRVQLDCGNAQADEADEQAL